MSDMYTKFKIQQGIQDKVKRFGLEIYDWGVFIFATMVFILVFKKIIIAAMLLDLLLLIFLKTYKKGKPDFYTASFLSFIFLTKELYILDPSQDKLESI